MDDRERTELLRIARETIARELGGSSVPVDSEVIFPPAEGGAFVTLRRDRRLRGCMGTFKPKRTLIETVDYVSRLACKDPRFASAPVLPEELSDIVLEMSILSRLERTDDPRSLRVGEHGIVIRRGEKSGCFLPQVAAEFGWDAERFLDQCCTGKAGLRAGAWQQSDVEVLLFSAEVFGEASTGG